MFDIYRKAYEAGKNDVIEEARGYKYIIYGDICKSMIGLKDTKEIPEDVYKTVMKVIDGAFSCIHNENVVV